MSEKRFRWPWEHVHIKLPVAVQIGQRTEHIGGPFSPSVAGDKLETTIVLRRCKCGRFDSVTIMGHWTLDQVQGTNVAGAAVSGFLDSVKVKP